MKITILALIAIGTFGLASMPGSSTDNQIDDETKQANNTVHLAAPVPGIQETAPETPPVVQDPPPPPAEASPSDVPVEHSVVDPLYVPQALYAPGTVCDSCCRVSCCCPVPTRFCLVDPCDGCSYEACVHLPPCCVGTTPQIEWRDGILGRKIISMCWPCCDKTARVVVPVFGDVRVWE